MSGTGQKQQPLRKAAVQVVTGPQGDHPGPERPAEKIEVTQEVENLVADKLVGEPKPSAGGNGCFSHHHGVFKASSFRKPPVEKGLYFRRQGEGAGRSEKGLEAPRGKTEVGRLGSDGSSPVGDNVG
jgi:hypothetical protein